MEYAMNTIITQSSCSVCVGSNSRFKLHTGDTTIKLSPIYVSPLSCSPQVLVSILVSHFRVFFFNFRLIIIIYLFIYVFISWMIMLRVGWNGSGREGNGMGCVKCVWYGLSKKWVELAMTAFIPKLILISILYECNGMEGGRNGNFRHTFFIIWERNG